MNNQPQTRYIKTFSKGQITIPKEIRDSLGLGDEFWIKLSVDQDEIRLQPVKEEKKMSKDEWIKRMMAMPPIEIDVEEIAANRKQWDKQIKDREL